MREMRPEDRGNEAVQFIVGIIMLGAGLYMLSNRAYVHSSWVTFRIGSFNMASGLVTVPLIIGIIWHFYKPDLMAPKLTIVLGVVIIIAALLMNTHISFERMSLYEYILIFGLIAAGCGLLLKTLFRTKE